MVAGENEQLKLLGSPLQSRAMALLKDPDCAWATTWRVPDCPAGIVNDVGEAVKLRVGGGGGTLLQVAA
jgi:hypothetical protein